MPGAGVVFTCTRTRNSVKSQPSRRRPARMSGVRWRTTAATAPAATASCNVGGAASATRTRSARARGRARRTAAVSTNSRCIRSCQAAIVVSVASIRAIGRDDVGPGMVFDNQRAARIASTGYHDLNTIPVAGAHTPARIITRNGERSVIECGGHYEIPVATVSGREVYGPAGRQSRQTETHTDHLPVLEAPVVEDSTGHNFLPIQGPIAETGHSSSFGYRINPFTDQQ